MKTAIYGAMVFRSGRFVPEALFIDDGRVVSSVGRADRELFFHNCHIFPGFADVHVHLREPGFSYKETIRTGTAAAARGGYTAVCSMPNLSPVPDCMENLRVQLDMISRDAAVKVYPYGAITRSERGEELSDMPAMSQYVVAFSDDGKGVQDAEMMKAAMLQAKPLGKLIAAHCEDEALLHGGCVHDGKYAREQGLKGISSQSEWHQLARDIRLARETGCAYHACHISTKESVALIRSAKADGVNITCETAPHYLVLNDGMLRDEGRFKMNPPIRDESDRQALLDGLRDGTIDMIATDHAPHSQAEKAGGLSGSLMGVSGLEAAFPVLYSKLVCTGEISLARLTELMALSPRRRFGIGGGTSPGDDADFCVIDLDKKFKIDSGSFLSMGKATPFEGMEVSGKVIYTAVKGETAWQEK